MHLGKLKFFVICRFPVNETKNEQLNFQLLVLQSGGLKVHLDCLISCVVYLHTLCLGIEMGLRTRSGSTGGVKWPTKILKPPVTFSKAYEIVLNVLVSTYLLSIIIWTILFKNVNWLLSTSHTNFFPFMKFNWVEYPLLYAIGNFPQNLFWIVCTALNYFINLYCLLYYIYYIISIICILYIIIIVLYYYTVF